ncbi:hypothetical protein [Bacteroides caecimuris]|uniref:hypothetical protein n=1 Tax=Bacteroides caecimuris TaxID=1796613 RepID=UPI001C3E7199|nr:hypothetical protein [Bacteroides caecimuris]
MDNFGRYILLKSQYDLVYKGIHLNRVLAMNIWSIANKSFHMSWKQYFLILFAIDIRKIKFTPGMHNILSTFGRYRGRNDHLELYNTVITKLGSEVAYNDTTEWTYRLSIHPHVILQILNQGFRMLKKTSLTFKEQCQLLIFTIHYCNLIEDLDKLSFSHVKKYLCQCNVLDLENLLTQYCKLKHIPTYSLQEGIYFIFKKNPPVDLIQYENFETDNLMCWGKFSVDEFISYGISPSRLSIAGYPKKVEIKLIKQNNSFKRCMILVARDSFRNTNMALLNILSNYSDEYEFYIKLHPSCDYSFYSNYSDSHNMIIVPKETTVNECLINSVYDFAVAVNTTAYYEALMRGLPCLRFYDGTFDLMAGCNDLFGTDEEFVKQINLIRKLPLSDYQKEVDEILEYAMGVGIDNYKATVCE